MTTMRLRAALTVAAICGALLPAGPLAAQTGPCAASPLELARAVTTARTPALAPAQQSLFAAAVGALRQGKSAEAGRQLGALLRTSPALATHAGLCALVHAAVRQGTLERDPRARGYLQALARTGTGGTAQDTGKASQECQQAVTTIANIQKAVHDDALKIIGNLRA